MRPGMVPTAEQRAQQGLPPPPPPPGLVHMGDAAMPRAGPPAAMMAPMYNALPGPMMPLHPFMPPGGWPHLPAADPHMYHPYPMQPQQMHRFTRPYTARDYERAEQMQQQMMQQMMMQQMMPQMHMQMPPHIPGPPPSQAAEIPPLMQASMRPPAAAAVEPPMQASMRPPAAAAVEPPPFHTLLDPSALLDHLILQALELPAAPSADGAKLRAECTHPHLGIELSQAELSFKPAVPGEVQTIELAVTNTSSVAVLLKACRFIGPLPVHDAAAPPFRCERLGGDGGVGALLPPRSEHTLTITATAPDERGLVRQWLFVQVEAMEASERAVTVHHFVLGATIVLYTIHPDTRTLLSAEAAPFFPHELRALWRSQALFGSSAPHAFGHVRRPKLMRAQIADTEDTDVAIWAGGPLATLAPKTGGRKSPLESLPGLPPRDLDEQNPLAAQIWSQLSAEHQLKSEEVDCALKSLLARAAIASTSTAAPVTAPMKFYSVHSMQARLQSVGREAVDALGLLLARLSLARLHTRRLATLLRLEARRMAQDYERMDVFSVEVRTRLDRGKTWDEKVTFTVEVPGLQEQHPPVQQGDELRFRLADFPCYELGLRVANVAQRTMLVLQPSLTRQQIENEGEKLLAAIALHKISPSLLPASFDRAKARSALQSLNRSPASRLDRSGEQTLCHLRFCLNTTMTAFMELTMRRLFEHIGVFHTLANQTLQLTRLLPPSHSGLSLPFQGAQLQISLGELALQLPCRMLGLLHAASPCLVALGPLAVDVDPSILNYALAPELEEAEVGEFGTITPEVIEARLRRAWPSGASGVSVSPKPSETELQLAAIWASSEVLIWPRPAGVKSPPSGPPYSWNESWRRIPELYLLAACEHAILVLTRVARTWRSRRGMPAYAASRATRLQPQLNAEQWQAVTDVLDGSHLGVPYLVFGPPGTGKTMVVLEMVVQTLVHHPRPRLLVTAPSNAAADVLAIRLHEKLPFLHMRRLAAQCNPRCVLPSAWRGREWYDERECIDLVCTLAQITLLGTTGQLYVLETTAGSGASAGLEARAEPDGVGHLVMKLRSELEPSHKLIADTRFQMLELLERSGCSPAQCDACMQVFGSWREHSAQLSAANQLMVQRAGRAREGSWWESVCLQESREGSWCIELVCDLYARLEVALGRPPDADELSHAAGDAMDPDAIDPGAEDATDKQEAAKAETETEALEYLQEATTSAALRKALLAAVHYREVPAIAEAMQAARQRVQEMTVTDNSHDVAAAEGDDAVASSVGLQHADAVAILRAQRHRSLEGTRALTQRMLSRWRELPSPPTMLRLNSMQRTLDSVPSTLLQYCQQDLEVGNFSVPPLEKLLEFDVIVATCGATHLLYEAGLPFVSESPKVLETALVEKHHTPRVVETDADREHSHDEVQALETALEPPSAPHKEEGRYLERKNERMRVFAGTLKALAGLLAEAQQAPTQGFGSGTSSKATDEAAKVKWLDVDWLDKCKGAVLVGHFTHVLVDEASQALESEEMLPLAFAGVGCAAVLCGDHKQLGPVVRSPFGREHGLGVSLLERLMRLPVYQQAGTAPAPAPPAPTSAAAPSAAASSSAPAQLVAPRTRCMTKLVRNYRSAGALLQLPSELSYDGELVECADKSVTGSMGAWTQLVTEHFPLLFYGCTSAHSLYKVDASSAHPSSSYRNVTEAEKLVDLIESLLAQEMNVAHTGAERPRECTREEGEEVEAAEKAERPSMPADLVAAASKDAQAPAQSRTAASATVAGGVPRRRITTNDIGVVTPFRAQVLHVRNLLRRRGYGAVRVGTVDDYQGQEELIIIISTVVGSANTRSIGTLAHGLMASPQRFNVAITRAKALLVIVADPNALWEDTHWRKLLQYAVDNRAYRGCAHPLLPTGADDNAVDAIASLISQAARRTLLGGGHARAMFPGLDSSLGAGDYDDVEEEQGWKMY
jgi:hypothetical protein